MSKRVLLGMSGGVDSSVVAMKLHNEGYEVIGLTFIFSDLDRKNEIVINEAQTLAEKLQIRHYIADLRKVFNELIINYFTS